MKPDRVQAVPCSNCHQFTGSSKGVYFCSTACIHEWSSKLIDAETPSQIWEIVKLAKQLAERDAGNRAAIMGKLVQLTRAIWPNETEKQNG